ncbi:MAG: hypothetical protein R3183_05045 [Oleiphilaceae bacterium]|nr:hypothetical protein [Oleiphilaceae bacterium]
MTKPTLNVWLFSATVALGLGGCASQQTSEQTVETASETAAMQTATVAELYEVHHDGRIYFFYDRGLYEDFVKIGHTAYMVARIGAGPKGETLKYALTGADKKKREGIPSIDLIEGKAQPASPFYGEVRSEGRIYVFDQLEDMNAFRKVGEAPYRFTQIGAGPKGETLVFVLNKTNKKEHPAALIEAFKQRNS